MLIYPGKVSQKYEPLGTALIIGSWNYPFSTILIPLVSAIAAGNTAVIKPSEQSPYSSNLLEKIIFESLDNECYTVINGGKNTGVYLNCLPFDVIVFTGSPQVGKFVMKDASRNLSKVILELGGTNPTIVDKTCNIKLTAKRVAVAKFSNCGQTCITCNHVYIHESVYDEFVQALKDEIQRMFGKEASECRSYSRIINEFHTKRLLDLLSEAHDKHIWQTGKPDVETRFIPPTLIEGLDKSSKLIQEEIFGPILPLLKFNKIDEVILDINDGHKSLNINYYGNTNSTNYRRLKNETSSGALLTNDHLLNYFSGTTGFGGVGNSGIGRILGFPGFVELSNCKAIIGKYYMNYTINYCRKRKRGLFRFRF